MENDLVKVLNTDNFSIRYMKFGNGKKNLIFIPGISLKSPLESAQGIKNTYKIFGEDFTVYFFDRRDNYPENFTIEDNAEDIYDAICNLNLHKVSICGFSQGGMIAQCLALNHPDVIDKIVLGSTLACENETIHYVLCNWCKLAELKKSYGLAENMVDTIFWKKFLSKFKKLIMEMYREVSDEELVKFINVSKSCFGFDVYDKIEKIKNPVLVLGAENDNVVTAQSSYDIAEKIPNARIYMYTDYGHAVYDEASDYKQRIYDFLTRN